MKKSGKTLRKSGKSQGKIREFDGIKKVGTLCCEERSSVGETFPDKFPKLEYIVQPKKLQNSISGMIINLVIS